MSGKLYCFDTCALVEPWTKYYKPEMHPKFWKHIEILIKQKRLIASPEVFEEVKKQQDSLKVWMGKQKELMIKPITPEIQKNVREILKVFPKMLNLTKNKSMADPWVIALAMEEEAVVVTKEGGGRLPDNPKIPDVCRHFNIEYIDDIEFAQIEKIFTR